MATTNITCTPTDLWTGSGGHTLDPEVSSEIWDRAFEGSAILRAARHIRIPGSGLAIPVITSGASASWVGETCAKPVTDAPTWEYRTIRPYKIAVIETFSREFERDRRELYRHFVDVLPRAIWQAFDETVYGLRPVPGSDFDSLADCPTVDLDDADSTYAGLTQALTDVANAGGDITAWVGGPQLRAKLQTATDALGHPFFVNNPAGDRQVGSVFGAPVYINKDAKFEDGVIGIAGDFADGAIVGTVGNIEIRRSDQASVVTKDGLRIDLWQQNMTAVLVEFEIGFIVKDPNLFVKIAGTATGGNSQSGLGPVSSMSIENAAVATPLVEVEADTVNVEGGIGGGSTRKAAEPVNDSGIVAEAVVDDGPFGKTTTRRK